MDLSPQLSLGLATAEERRAAHQHGCLTLHGLEAADRGEVVRCAAIEEINEESTEKTIADLGLCLERHLLAAHNWC